MTKSNRSTNISVLKTLRSVQFAIVLLIAIVVVAVVGTLIPQGKPMEFYSERYGTVVSFIILIFRFYRVYSSPLFIGLSGLLVINLILCSLVKLPSKLKFIFKPERMSDIQKLKNMPIYTEFNRGSFEDVFNAFSGSHFPLRRVGENCLYGEKGRFGYLGSSIVHISLILLLFGGLISFITGKRGIIVLEKGDTASALIMPDGSEIPLGFSIKLDQFEVDYHKTHPRRPKSYTSSVTVTQVNGKVFLKNIMVNHPLILNGFTVYQSEYGISKKPLTGSSENDKARIEVSLKGAPKTIPPIATFKMAVGDEVNVPGFDDSIKVRLAELYRDFKRAGSSGEVINPAVKIDVLVNDTVRWSVFAFKNFPGLNMPMNQNIDLSFSMLDLLIESDELDLKPANEYYTVLGVVKDNGIPVVWAGGMLMIIGLLLSLYVRPGRIWVCKENSSSVLIGARTKGDPEPLRKLIRKILKNAAKGNTDGEAK